MKRDHTVIDTETFDIAIASLSNAILKLREEFMEERKATKKDLAFLANSITYLENYIMTKEEQADDHVRDPRDYSAMPVDTGERYEKHGEEGRKLGLGVKVPKNRCQG